MDEKTLNDLLECSVCLERLDTSSKVLPCQHTFCRKCLEVIVQSHQELRCPECRVLIESKIEELPPNVLLMRILEGMKNTAHNQNNSAKSPKNLVNLQNNTGTENNLMANNPKLITANHVIITTNRGQDDQIISTKHLIPHAVAIYDFNSKETGDLSIKAGDIIIMRKPLDHNWCVGELNGREGTFPLNHVQVITPLPQPRCIALYDFRMGPNEEEGCLAFKKDTIINVIRRVDHNWAEGRIGESIGIFPIAFVEMNLLAKYLMESAKHIQIISSRIVPPKPFENITSSDSSSTITTSPNSSSTSNTSSNSSTAPSSPTANLNTGQQKPQQQQTTHKSHENNKEKRHSLTTVLSSKQQANLLQTNRHSVEILNPSDHDGKTPKPSVRQKNDITSQTSSRTTHKLTNYQRFQNLPAVVEAIFPYKPQNPDELELKKGSVYYVTERCEDGWLKGSNRSKKTGVFPGNYVVLMRTREQQNGQQNTTNTRMTQQSGGLVQTNQVPGGLVQYQIHTPPELPPRNNSPSSSSSTAAAAVNTTSSQQQSIWSKPLGSVDALFNRKTTQTSNNNQIKNEKMNSTIVNSGGVGIGGGSGSSKGEQSPPVTSTSKDKKESSSAVSLMKRLTNMKRSKSPITTTNTTSSSSSSTIATSTTTTASSSSSPYSLDNPVYDDSPSQIPTSSKHQIQITHPVHVRSGSCPSQLLQSLPLDINNTSINQLENSPSSLLYGSKRVKSQGKERPSLQDLRNNTSDTGMIGRNKSIDSAGPSSSTAITSTIIPGVKQQQQHLHCTIANHNNQIMPSSYHRKSQSLDASTITSQLNGTPSKNKSHHHQNITRERFKCIVPYPPNSEYELELHIGDIVFVHKKRDNGWYKGTVQRQTGLCQTGLFPASFVEPDI